MSEFGSTPNTFKTSPSTKLLFKIFSKLKIEINFLNISSIASSIKSIGPKTFKCVSELNVNGPELLLPPFSFFIVYRKISFYFSFLSLDFFSALELSFSSSMHGNADNFLFFNHSSIFIFFCFL